MPDSKEPSQSPEVHPWLQNEAYRDEQLMHLLLLREEMVDDRANTPRSSMDYPIEDGLESVEKEIISRKIELGIIEPLQDPPSERE